MATLQKQIEKQKQGLMSEDDLVELVHEVGESPLINRRAVVDWLMGLVLLGHELVRYNAVRALAFHAADIDWDSQEGRSFFSSLLTMVEADSDSDCRRVAAAAFGSFFRGSRNHTIAKQLAKVTRNVAEDWDVRGFAYVSFLEVSGIPKESIPDHTRLVLLQEHLDNVQSILDSYALM